MKFKILASGGGVVCNKYNEGEYIVHPELTARNVALFETLEGAELVIEAFGENGMEGVDYLAVEI